MNYHDIESPSMLNGEGLRTVLWVAGCTHNCPGCHNPETHPFDSGIRFDSEALEEIIEKSRPDYIEGLTLSGGDPFMPENIMTTAEVAKLFKFHFPKKNIWAYTGYTWEKLMLRKDENTLKLLSNIDVLVDGRFVIELKDPTLHFRGSTNQRIIDVKKSLPEVSNPVVINL